MKTSWQQDLKQQGKELSQYTDEVERKLRQAEKALAELAGGLVSTEAASYNWATDVKMRVTAAKELAKLSTMPCRRRPYLGYI